MVVNLLAKVGVSREKGFHKAYLLSEVQPFSGEKQDAFGKFQGAVW